MSVTAEDIARIAAEMWRDTAGQEATVAASAGAADLSGCIAIDGAFRGAVSLRVPRAVARAAAVVMFARSAVDDADERDALGELANMVGGHIKAMVAGPSRLGLPSVHPAGETCMQLAAMQLVAEQAMAVPAGTFVVLVYEALS